jgi:hypothetical protein
MIELACALGAFLIRFEVAVQKAAFSAFASPKSANASR